MPENNLQPSKESVEAVNRVYENHFDGLSGKKTVASLALAIEEAYRCGRESMREEAAQLATRAKIVISPKPDMSTAWIVVDVRDAVSSGIRSIPLTTERQS